MKKNTSDFDKLNRLLVACFEAERLYFNAAQDAQDTELKRFLNYMAVERNRMSHDISNELNSRNIEPLKQDAEKDYGNRSWQEIKEALEYFDAKLIIESCTDRDRYNIRRYDELIENKALPHPILEMLEKHRFQLEWYVKQAMQHLKTNPFKEDKKPPKDTENSGGKVINLKAI